VERSQRTDLEEFYSTADLKGSDLQDRLRHWQDHYNQFRPHGSLGGLTPWRMWEERLQLTPFRNEVEVKYDSTSERIRHPVYRVDLELMEREKKIGKQLAHMGALPRNPRDLAPSHQDSLGPAEADQ
jgi:hypothetical protein